MSLRERPLEAIISDLGNRDGAIRGRAAIDLQHYVNTLPPEIAVQGKEDLLARCFALMNSSDLRDRLAGVSAMEQLVDIVSSDPAKFIRIATSLQRIFISPDPLVTIIATRVFAVMCHSTLLAGHAEIQVKTTIEWLQGERSEHKYYAAVIALRELAQAVPNVIFNHIFDILENIWVALRDTSMDVRLAASDAFTGCLGIVIEKNTVWGHIIEAIYREIEIGFRMGTTEGIHASLLAHKSVFEVGGRVTRRNMKRKVFSEHDDAEETLISSLNYLSSQYNTSCKEILRYQDSKESVVRNAVVQLIPFLASYRPNTFCNYFIHKSVMFLLSQLRSPNDSEKIAAFVAVGQVALNVKDAMMSYLESILVELKVNLRRKTSTTGLALASAIGAAAGTTPDPSRGLTPTVEAVFQCIAYLCHALKAAMTKHIHEMLDLMFAYGLSDALKTALTQIGTDIPSVMPEVQERLINLLSEILSGHPFVPAGGPRILATGRASHHGPASERPSGFLTTPGTIVNGATPQAPPPNPNSYPDTTVHLALVTLGEFSWAGLFTANRSLGLLDGASQQTLSEFVRDFVLPYTTSDAPGLRKAAAIAATQVLGADAVILQTSPNAIALVGDALERILTLSIGDPDALIREATLNALDDRFDKHLAQSRCVRSLFLALNDEVYAIRKGAMVIIGRLSHHNPAYVMPALRRTLIELLTELEHSASDTDKAEAAGLLGILMGTSQRLTKPYVGAIMDILLVRSKDPAPGVATSVIVALGELARVGGEGIAGYIRTLVPLVLAALHDQSAPARRHAAIRTLGQIASHAPYVIDAYAEHPTLLPTLVTLLKTETARDTRRELVRTMGLLGAADPYKYVPSETAQDASFAREPEGRAALSTEHITPSHDEYYPTIAFNALLHILGDASLSDYHTSTVDAIMYIFRSLRLKVVTFLPLVLPVLISVTRHAHGNQEYYFQNLAQLIRMVRQHIRGHVRAVVDLVREYWGRVQSRAILIDVIQSLALSLEAEFKLCVADLLPLLLETFADARENTKASNAACAKALVTLVCLAGSLEEHLHLVIPPLIHTYASAAVPPALRRQAINTLGVMCDKVDFGPHASRIIHPVARIVPGVAASAPELVAASLDVLCTLMSQMQDDFLLYVPMLTKAFARLSLKHAHYSSMMATLRRGERVARGLNFATPVSLGNTESTVAADAGLSKLPVNQAALQAAWAIGSEHSNRADDWREWFRKFSVQLLRSSPSLSLRACANLAEQYVPLARDLFNAAFVSCWSELYESYREELVDTISRALSSSSMAADVTQALLNLAEFMEHDDKMLPIAFATLGGYALKCRAYAKALHYKELEYISAAKPSVDVVEELIKINNSLQLPDTSSGILTHARAVLHFDLKEEWFVDLGRWEDAMAAFQRKRLSSARFDADATLGEMRCLHALGEWEGLARLTGEYWDQAGSETQRKMAPLAAAASWGLGQWSNMDVYISVLKHDSADRAWFKSILSVHRGEFSRAQSHINRARDLLDSELTTLVNESYNRAYDVVVRVQMLSELEEIIEYKEALAAGDLERRVTLQRAWLRRLEGSKRDVDVWQRILKVRALVIKPHDDIDIWVKFANLCRKSERLTLCEKSLNLLFNGPAASGPAGVAAAPPQVIYSNIKYLWATGAKHETLRGLKEFTNKLAADLNARSVAPVDAAGSYLAQYTKILSRCYYKTAEWQKELHDDNWVQEYAAEILESYFMATKLDPTWYKAQHAWALSNVEVAGAVVGPAASITGPARHAPIPTETLMNHIIPSVAAFFRAIALSPSNTLQDSLRLLTLYFKNGEINELNAAFKDGLRTVSINTWLEVIPQLIARIHSPYANVKTLIHDILIDIGKAHPQALVYPLTVASKDPSSSRRRAALSILDNMREHSSVLVEQALLVSQELIRVAILWHELWHEGLEEASRLFYGDHNVEAMFATLEPLHDLVEGPPQTLRETSFVQTFGRDLSEARAACRRFRDNGGEVTDLNHAWDLYYQVFRKIQKSLSGMTLLEMQYVSPKLLAVSDLELAIPGQYSVDHEVVRISRFGTTSEVFTSKQRPRKIRIYGSDGKEYKFLLKGHEDLRQDERVMQLFGLVNTLLQKDPETFKRHLLIVKYPVIPLSPNSGLLGWVDSTDTLHVLIKSYRDSHKILLNIEHRLILQMAPDFDHLCMMQKLEVFEYSLDNTTGQDFYRVLWLKSKNSEAWLDRRTNYGRTLAVMSMVGYILGLGDRHPSNLLMDRFTGRIVHVDFGDCFEVAMHREKHPEKVPFRLTRMLRVALEVSGVEGTFKVTSEETMRVLRENKESILAVLEAFVHDPLVNWRLVRGAPTTTDEETHFQVNARAMEVVGRVENKLTGRDFNTRVLTVKEQVEKLIDQAMALENLCQCFIGWCPFW